MPPHILMYDGGASVALLYLLFFVLAVSVDGLAVGMGLGFGRIKISLAAFAVISFVSFFVILPALSLGDYIAGFLHPAWSRWLGGIILLIMGMVFLLSGLGAEKPVLPTYKVHLNEKKRSFWRRFLYLLHNPLGADLDHSGNINIWEASLLGFALAVDAFGAGFGAAITGYPVLLTSAMVGLGKFLLLRLGYRFGFYLSGNWDWRILSILPGLFLIILGILKIVGV